MVIRETPKYYVWNFHRYELLTDNGNTSQFVPARVYVRKDEFAACAKHYGWGDAKPNDPGQHGQTVGEILYDALKSENCIARVCIL